MLRKHKSEEIRKFIIDIMDDFPSSISRKTAEKFGISRQAVSRHLSTLEKDGIITSKGKTRNKEYYLVPIAKKEYHFKVNENLEEDVIWRQKVNPILESNVKKNILSICHHGFTEMYNNVVDHSEAGYASISCEYNAARAKMRVIDDGIGIFTKIMNHFKLEDHRHAILELSKGKVTTDTEKHTGEGIFFTSRMFDLFAIYSSNLFFSRFHEDDWLLEGKSEIKGTAITMQINLDSNKTDVEIFNKYAPEIEYGFTRTKIPVALAIYGEENLVSRSQAKRLLARLDGFREVIFDFSKVNFIGPAFTDEIFRVFKNDNPNVNIRWISTNEEIEKMINKVMINMNDEQTKLNFTTQ